MKRVKYDIEMILRASPAIVYKFLTDPSCLIRWFCDRVDIEKDVFTFEWQGVEEVAHLIDDIEEERLKFKWEDADDEDEYLEFRISQSPLTGETILEITDWADADDIEEQILLWETQIDAMRRESGG